jgi:2',3'-cyclic-nucleotide 2'-phosphodiesterase/3'-nucleotidase
LWFDEERKGGKVQLKNMSFNFDSAAGIIYTVDVTKPKGEKVNIISLADGTPFDMDKYYTVAVNSYRGNGGGGLLTNGTGLTQDQLKERILSSTDHDLRYYLMEYIREQGVVKPKELKQWKFIPEKMVKPAIKRNYKLLFGYEGH